MKKIAYILLLNTVNCFSQPEIYSWLQNTETTGNYYIAGSPVLVPNNILVNCQKVQFSNDYVYVTATGVPSYPTGPFLDGNPSNAQNQAVIFKITRNPQQNLGDLTYTTPGNIGVFINGVALFDYRDGVAWNPNTNQLCGGPGNPPCPGGFLAEMDWNRDAILAEMEGFDCAKGHPAMGNYHHHQNPSAFKLDRFLVSDVCDLYDSDGLYVIDSTVHSPLLGYAFDGFPIYGAYGYQNNDGSGGVVRIESGYNLRNITERTHHADGTDVEDGPSISEYFLGYFREDYEFIDREEDKYLDEHNGRLCVTPEYPEGTYAYFCTVDENWNSKYPYAVGPTFYGEYSNSMTNSILEQTTTYYQTNLNNESLTMGFSAFINKSSEIIIVQCLGLVKENTKVNVIDLNGKILKMSQIFPGQTLTSIDSRTLYNGLYIVEIIQNNKRFIKKLAISR
jgi:hypothetical protein